ncbi:hypothetical protein C8035_v005658 [Colletotrichum spinosum]|uniref:Uncharacterized protein n=2 Tax=Colletotrichum orbiculare species complex TaxID=2707354 RepID=A0A4R8RQ94_COLTR|nr:hypothetical protein C8035_v005658 [Colletotrichum spinosum]TDZ55001.1 hypothetical protein CTRI78_v005798 [Colletotrichum trifolii]
MQFTNLVALACAALCTSVAAERFQAFASNNCGGVAKTDVTIGSFDCRVLSQPIGSFFAQPLPGNCGWFAFSGTDCGKGEGFGSFQEGVCSTETTSGGAAGNVQSVMMKCT